MFNSKKCLENIDVRGKRVLLRCDLNVPLNDKSKILDDIKIYQILPTIKYLIENDAKVIICSHIGEASQKLSLKPVARRLEKILNIAILFFTDIIGDTEVGETQYMRSGEVALLENLNLYPGEESNSKSFAKQLARYGDIYINDAFSCWHKRHASISAITKYIPSYNGLLARKEVVNLERLRSDVARPYKVIIGGDNICDKETEISWLIRKIDTLILGFPMAYPFISANGGKIGSYKVNRKDLSCAQRIINQAKERWKTSVKILIPVDCIAVKKIEVGAESIICDSFNIPNGYFAVDIGPKTIELYKKEFNRTNWIFLNDSLGECKIPDFTNGTNSILEALAMTGTNTYISGSYNIRFVKKSGLRRNITHLSIGEEATLKYMSPMLIRGLEEIEYSKLN